MRQFCIPEEGIKRIRTKTVISYIPLFSLAIMALVYLTIADARTDSDNNPFWIFIFIYVIIFASRARRNIKRLPLQLKSLTITLTNNSITQASKSTSPVSISFYNITEILRLFDGSLVIKSNDKKSITIPIETEDYYELSISLNLIRPIKNGPRPFYQRASGIVALLGMLAAMLMSATKSHAWLIISASVVISVVTMCMYNVQINPMLDIRNKRKPWLSLFVVALIMYVVILRLTGGS